MSVRPAISDEAKWTLLGIADRLTTLGNAAQHRSLRHQLITAAGEIASLSGGIDAPEQPGNGHQPCLIYMLEREVACAEKLFPNRSGTIRLGIISLDFRPSLSAEIVLGLVVRALIQEAICQSDPGSDLRLGLHHDHAILHCSIDCSSGFREDEVMDRMHEPKCLRSLLRSLSGRLYTTRNGISIRIPIESCTPIGPFWDTE
jgi:hypothetical protein